MLVATPYGIWGTRFAPLVPQGVAMSVQYDAVRKKFVVRWRDGGQRNRRFVTEAEAVDFEQEVGPSPQATALRRSATALTARPSW